ncbi:hypothetical protein [uncultured Paraglaciecola sp.]|uniref:hypothetical protein n=1 Tax=uncultured Paraglaciecola sp. TaxID=1765024 RepID=UPI00262A04B1|nr:hypothetical protein [uncultured Paraglaciecola sp.]
MSNDKYIDQQWYLSGPPWFPSSCVDLMILAGSPDGNVGQVIADQSLLADIGQDNEHMPDVDQLRVTAKHIVDLHNTWLDQHNGR